MTACQCIEGGSSGRVLVVSGNSHGSVLGVRAAYKFFFLLLYFLFSIHVSPNMGVRDGACSQIWVCVLCTSVRA